MSRRKFTTTLEEDVIRKLKLQAIQEQTAVNKIIERLVEEYLKRQQIQEKQA